MLAELKLYKFCNNQIFCILLLKTVLFFVIELSIEIFDMEIIDLLSAGNGHKCIPNFILHIQSLHRLFVKFLELSLLVNKCNIMDYVGANNKL